MKMVFRWFGENDDSVSLKEIKQIPGISGVVSALTEIPVGKSWPESDIIDLKNRVNRAGLELKVIESINVHENIKLGSSDRDKYIKNYIASIKNLSKAGIEVICYNFMPLFDWLRTNLEQELKDGSRTMAYDQQKIENTDPVEIVKSYAEDSQGFSLPGWEAEKLDRLQSLLEKYKKLSVDELFENLKYFLKKIIPVCEQYEVKMAIHPADPPWPVFNIPRLAVGKRNLERVINLVDSEYNGLTLCSGSLGINPENSIPDIIRYFGKKERIHFVHARNFKIETEGKFYESSHLSSEGSLDMYEIMKALYDINFTGYLRPDHGRMIWEEKARPGYGLYDRALGVAYLNGLWEAINKGEY
ncbi:MAG: mannonate dehydratase [Halanaerobiales bacterium]